MQALPLLPRRLKAFNAHVTVVRSRETHMAVDSTSGLARHIDELGAGQVGYHSDRHAAVSYSIVMLCIGTPAKAQHTSERE